MPRDSLSNDSGSEVPNGGTRSNSGDFLHRLFFDKNAHALLNNPTWGTGDRLTLGTTEYEFYDDAGKGPYLDEGGQGSVWAAKDMTGNPIVIKFIDSDNRERVKKVLAIVAERLQPHPHVIQVIDGPYECLDGLAVVLPRAEHSLDKMVGMWEGHQPLGKRLLNLMRQAAQGIDYLNSKGLCHRDIKPANLLRFHDESVVVGDLDFLVDIPTGDKSAHVSFLKTPGFTAPEAMAQNDDGTHTYTKRSDQASFAKTFFTLRTGKGVDQLKNLYEIITDPRESAVVAKALADLPRNRYRSCTEFIEALDKLSSEIDKEFNKMSQTNPKRQTEVVLPTASADRFLRHLLKPDDRTRELMEWAEIDARIAADNCFEIMSSEDYSGWSEGDIDFPPALVQPPKQLPGDLQKLVNDFVPENDVNFKKCLITKTPISTWKEERLRIELAKSDYFNTKPIHDSLHHDTVVEDGKRCKPWKKYGKNLMEFENCQLPIMVCIHAIVMLPGDKLLIARRVPNRDWTKIKMWSLSFEQQMNPGTRVLRGKEWPEDKTFFDTAKAGLYEEFAFEEADIEANSTKVLSLIMDSNACVVDVLTIMRLKCDLNEVIARGPLAPDREHDQFAQLDWSMEGLYPLLAREPIEVKNEIRGDGTIKIDPEKDWHISSRMRALAALFHKDGYGNTLINLEKWGKDHPPGR